MGIFDRCLHWADRFQQRHRVLAFPAAVLGKFYDDRAGNLASLISYYAFLAIFPLLLILVTVLNIVLRDTPSVRSTLLTSALSQYPVIGTQLKNDLGSITATGLPLLIGILVLLYGVRKVAGAMQNALCEVWGIKREDRPGFPVSWVWGFALVFVVGLGFIVTTFLSGLVGGAGDLISGAGAYVGAALISLVLNFGVFWLGFRIATLFRVPWHGLRNGAGIAAIFWQVLQVVGGYVVSHQLHRASDLYGTFGIVLGLLAWLFLQAEITLYAAEVDVVWSQGLWPRHVLGPAPEPGPVAAEPAPQAAAESVPEAAAALAPEAPVVPVPQVPATPEPVKGPAPRGPASVAGHAYDRAAARWFSRVRRAVGRREKAGAA
jgi:membrane protein